MASGVLPTISAALLIGNRVSTTFSTPGANTVSRKRVMT
jgi:hypothetical protein